MAFKNCSWSSDTYSIMVMNLADGSLRRLTAENERAADPAWSPDGRSVAFSSDRLGNWDIYIADLVTGNTRQLTDNVAQDQGP
ncbi:MAG: TolB family protein, partial [Planctomycetota bacterium]